MLAEGNLVWLDLEMTGLEPERDRILEIATIVTDSELNILAEGPDIVIHQPESALENLDPWVQNQHTVTGLFDQVRQSRVTDREAELATLEFIKPYVAAGISPMSGNSIYQDRRFLYRYMPELEKYFHYRNLDVSTVKELARRWQPKLYEGFKKESRHRALDDIRDSIEELRFYRQHFFVKNIVEV